jgi:hypothetical protein
MHAHGTHLDGGCQAGLVQCAALPSAALGPKQLQIGGWYSGVGRPEEREGQRQPRLALCKKRWLRSTVACKSPSRQWATKAWAPTPTQRGT